MSALAVPVATVKLPGVLPVPQAPSGRSECQSNLDRCELRGTHTAATGELEGARADMLLDHCGIACPFLSFFVILTQQFHIRSRGWSSGLARRPMGIFAGASSGHRRTAGA